LDKLRKASTRKPFFFKVIAFLSSPAIFVAKICAFIGIAELLIAALIKTGGLTSHHVKQFFTLNQ
jgi:hypothetical protein